MYLKRNGVNYARLDSSGSANDWNKVFLNTTINIPQKGEFHHHLNLLASQQAFCSLLTEVSSSMVWSC
jgi:hypothetical protein